MTVRREITYNARQVARGERKDIPSLAQTLAITAEALMNNAGSTGLVSESIISDRERTPRTIAFNKPYGVLPCFTDSDGRPTLADYIDLPGVYAAGRLDLDSEGLLLLTSDGRLAHHITDPRHKLPKVYLAQVERIPNEKALEQLRKAVVLNGKKTRPAEVRLLPDDPQLPDRSVPIRFRKSVPTAWLEIVLREGLNRQVRRMTAAVGHPTLRLVRVAVGPVALGGLQSGEWRDLTSSEIEQIYSSPARR
jgi:23S rRNA pseudouridine2457 synthase